MNCLIPISHRQAIPVRAIPFITGWSLSPDKLAAILAGDDMAERMKDLRAYHLAHDGSYSPMLPKEWTGTVIALQVLSDSLKAGEGRQCASYLLWRERSIYQLPSHCFVWRDEFEPAALAALALPIYLDDEERLGETELNLSPRIPEPLIGIVFEGFDIPPSPRTTPKDITPGPGQNRESDHLQLLRQAHLKWWANANPNPNDPVTHPRNTDIAAWLTERGMSATLADKAAILLRPTWAHKGRKPDA